MVEDPAAAAASAFSGAALVGPVVAVAVVVPVGMAVVVVPAAAAHCAGEAPVVVTFAFPGAVSCVGAKSHRVSPSEF